MVVEVHCRLGATADRLITISDEDDMEDTDNDDEFCEAAHAAKNEMLNTAPIKV